LVLVSENHKADSSSAGIAANVTHDRHFVS